jgi:MFS superfamily sulfate permease-like transporter
LYTNEIKLACPSSLLYVTMVGQFYDPHAQQDDYIKGVTTMTVYIGLISIGFGILRLGLVIDYISPAVMTGFTTAYVIVTSVPQL